MPRTEKQLKNRVRNAHYRVTFKGWLSSKIQTIKRHARKNNYKSNITRKDLIKAVVRTCPALGYDLVFGHNGSRIPNLATIDRIDSTKGYIKGNVQILSDKANIMKSNASREELVSFAKWILGIKQ